MCCWDNGKCGRGRKQEEMHCQAFQKHINLWIYADVDLTEADADQKTGYAFLEFVCALNSGMHWSRAFVICLFVSPVTNKKPAHVSLTKVKQFQGSSAFVKRSQWTLDQLRQVNGIDPNKVMTLVIPFDRCYSVCAAQRCFGVNWITAVSACSLLTGLLLQDCPEFDLMFENAFDQWSAGSAGEKCTFIQILHHSCQRYCSARKPEFINCQSKLLGGKIVAPLWTSVIACGTTCAAPIRWFKAHSILEWFI